MSAEDENKPQQIIIYEKDDKVATQFRQWATIRLRNYIVKGFTMDDARRRRWVLLV